MQLGTKRTSLVPIIVLFLIINVVHAQPLRITSALVVAPRVSQLSWAAVPSASGYQLFRQYPGEGFEPLAQMLADTSFSDTLSRTICADTVNYIVCAHLGEQTLYSDTVGLYHHDNIPTAPCSLLLCSVDSVSNRIQLSWQPSPDPDVMGYFIVQGMPSRGYDTVWGRHTTTYLCREDLSQGLEETQYDFRILAFDSCYQASPLTPYYHNPVLHFAEPGCSRRFSCSWNPYINMPDSVARYTLHYRLEDQDIAHRFSIGADQPLVFDTVISDLAIGRVSVYLSVDNTADSLHAFSLRRTFVFPAIDSAEHLSIADAEYLDADAAVRLTILVDSAFRGSPISLFRKQGPRGEYALWATIDLEDGTSQYHYLDTDVHPAAGSYTYYLQVNDSCHLHTQLSDTLRLVLPPVEDPGAFLPNIIIHGHPQLGQFCSSLLSPLADGYQLSVYNRYGECVYATTSLTDCWTGDSPSGQPLPQGTYIYLIQCRHADGSLKKYKGTVTLIK